jgi:hypothetical protein
MPNAPPDDDDVDAHVYDDDNMFNIINDVLLSPEVNPLEGSPM